MILDELRKNFFNRACLGVAPVSEEEFETALVSNDEMFAVLASSRQQELVDYISATRAMDAGIVKKYWSGTFMHGRLLFEREKPGDGKALEQRRMAGLRSTARIIV